MKLSRTAAVLAVGAVLFAGGCSSGHGTNGTDNASADLESDGTTAPADPPEFIIHNDVSVSGPDDFTITHGDKVKFTIISDKDDELDIAGYDKKIALQSGQFATVDFTATTRGKFPMTIRSGAVITTLQVN